jgi:hypothetical protein
VVFKYQEAFWAIHTASKQFHRIFVTYLAYDINFIEELIDTLLCVQEQSLCSNFIPSRKNSLYANNYNI